MNYKTVETISAMNNHVNVVQIACLSKNNFLFISSDYPIKHASSLLNRSLMSHRQENLYSILSSEKKGVEYVKYGKSHAKRNFCTISTGGSRFPETKIEKCTQIGKSLKKPWRNHGEQCTVVFK